MFQFFVATLFLFAANGYASCPRYTEEQIKTIHDAELQAQKSCLEQIKNDNDYLVKRVNQVFLLNKSYCEKLEKFQKNCPLMAKFQTNREQSCQQLAIEPSNFSISTQSDASVEFRVVVELFSSPNGFVFHSQNIGIGQHSLQFQDQVGSLIRSTPPLAMARKVYLETISGADFPQDFIIENFLINDQMIFDDASVTQRNGSRMSVSLKFIDEMFSTNQACQITKEDIDKIQKDVQEAFE